MLHKEVKAEGVAFVGVNDEDAGTMKSFVSKNGYEIPVLMDARKQIHRRYGIRSIPTLFTIDRGGTIRQHFIVSRTREQIREDARKSSGANACGFLSQIT
jgi:peroxiredoxin